MNKITSFKALVFCALCSIANLSQAQVYFFMTDLEILPSTPTTQTPVSVSISGLKTDPCSYLQSHNLDINGNFIALELNWWNEANDPPFPTCPSIQEPWDTTFFIGLLDVGTYILQLQGNNFFSTGLPNEIIFHVIDGGCSDPDGNIYVTNTNDTGAGSLRQAIICANNIPGPNTIKFGIAGFGPHTIFVGVSTNLPLPALEEVATIIDATTQPGFGAGGNYQPQIILNGESTSWDLPINALTIEANGCEIYGLEIINFPDDAIDISSAHLVTIGDYNKGNVIYNNGSPIDTFPGLPFSGPWEGSGIFIQGNSSSNIIKGNIIGTNYDQTLDGGNEFCGIRIEGGGDYNSIGGLFNGEGNIITNNPTAIQIGNNSFGCAIRYNSIFCNDTTAIQLIGNANLEITAPEINFASAQSISGTAAFNGTIEVYLSDDTNCPNAPCQGKTLLGTTTVQSGNWILNAPFQNNITLSGGGKVTATLTEFSGSTSEFALCKIITGVSDCTDSNGDIYVATTNDEGGGSLRAAIDCANTTLGANTIKFNIPGNGPHIIPVGSTSGEPLPDLIDLATIIDGTTQPGFGINGNFQPQIILDGQHHNWNFPINAITVEGDFGEIYGLEIINFPDDAIDIDNANIVQIGKPQKGNVIYNNGSDTDYFTGAPNTGPWNGSGILLQHGSSQVNIQGNIIGTNYDKTIITGNEHWGIFIKDGGDHNNIGGTEPGEGNVIAYHQNGVQVDSNSTSCLILHNEIFCNDSIGIALIDNANAGIIPPVIDTVDFEFIGGTAASGTQFVEVFIHDDTSCGDVPCQGKKSLGLADVTSGAWSLVSPFVNGITLENGADLTALSIDSQNNTSEFTNCKKLAVCLPITVNVNDITDAICEQPNGSFELSVIGGTSPFQFDIGNGPVGDSLFTNLLAGVYDVTITDAVACTTTFSATVGGVLNPAISFSNIIDATCESANGGFTIEITNGTSPFQYNIGNGTVNNPVFSDLLAGTYVATVTDANSCSATSSVIISGTTIPLLNIANIMDASCEQANGGFTLVVTNGTSPYQFDIGNGLTSNPVFSNLPAGNYIATVTDGAGCTASINVDIPGTTNPTLTVNNIVATTCEQPNGSFTLVPANGLVPYQYDIGNGSQNDPDFINMPSGTYSATVTDANNCSATLLVIIPGDLNPTINIQNITAATCEQANGSFTLSVVNGTAPFQYNIGNGNVESPVFSNLAAGTYTVTVTDTNNCTAETSIIINGSTIPTLSTSSIQSASCEQANGGFTLSAANGTPPFQYNIGNGFVTNPVFTGLLAGTYIATVTDELGCSDVLTVIVDGTTNPQITIANTTAASCEQPNGGFTLMASNGTSPYQYDIGNGQQNSPVFSGLLSGTYQATVSDALGCTAEIPVELGGTTNPGIIVSNTQPATCNESNGSFTLEGSGGEQPYQYNVGNGNVSSPTFTGLPGGTYNVTISDNNSCTNSTTILIPQVEGPGLVINYAIDASCDNLNGIISVSGTAGTPPYQFFITGNSGNGPLFTGLGPGTYFITVTDVDNCEDVGMVTLGTTTSPSVSVTNIIPATCGEENGSFTAVGSGAFPPYTYSIGNIIQGNPVFSGLAGGTYTLVCQSINECFVTMQVTIPTTPSPVLSVMSLVDATCDEFNGAVTFSGSAGTPPYTYALTGHPGSGPVFNALNGGDYNVTIEDAAGCQVIQTVTIGNTPAPIIAVTDLTSAHCGLPDGTLTVTGSGGTSPYQFDIGNGPVNDPFFDELYSGFYTVSVIDANNCTDELNAIIDDTDPPIITVIEFNHPTCGEANGNITVDASDGLAPYVYYVNGLFYTSPVFTDLFPGTYTIEVEDFYGCTDVTTVLLYDLGGIPSIFFDNVNDASCELSNGSFEVDVVGGIAPFTYDIGNGAVSNAVFNNLFAGTYETTVTDAIGCTVVSSITLHNNGLLPTSGFFYTEDEGTMSFTNNSINANNYTWSFGDLTTSMEINPVHTYAESGDYLVCLTASNSCGGHQTCELVSIILPLAEVTIAGSIYKENGVAVGNVMVSCTGEPNYTTASDGYYEFTGLPTGDNYSVEPHKNINAGNGVNIFDVYLIQQHITFALPLNSPYKMIAADVNANGVISLLDVFYIQELIVANVDTFPNNESWRFVPEGFVFPNPANPFGSTFPETLVFNELDTDSLGQDFIGIKIGDVSLDADPLLVAGNGDIRKALNLVTTEQSGENGEIIQIDFTSNNFNGIAAYQVDLLFDAFYLELTNIVPGNLTGFEAMQFGQQFVKDGILNTVWYDATVNPDGVNLASDDVLFSLEFLVKNNFNNLSDLLEMSFSPQRKPLAFYPDGSVLDIQLGFETTTAITNFSSKEWKVYPAYPNPFSEQVAIPVFLPQATDLTFKVYDLSGRMVISAQQSLSAGTNTLIIDRQHLNGSGVYFYQIKSGNLEKQGKVVLE